MRIALTGATVLAVLLASQAGAQDSAPTEPYGPPVTHTTDQGSTTMTPHADGFDIAFQDLRGVTTRYAYGPTGQLLSETAPEIGTLRYRYDADGRLDRRVTGDGLTAVTAYDDQGRVIRQAMRDNGEDRIVTRYTHDECDNGEGRICRIIHNDHVARYAYTADGKLASVTQRLADEPEVERLRYDYRSDGQLDRIRYPSGLVVRYHYDADDALIRLTGQYETGEDRARFVIARNITRDADGRLTGLTHGNGLRTRLQRADTGALTRITLAQDGTVIDRADFARDADGRITAIDRLDDASDRRFTYDARGRLVTETTGDGTPSTTTRIDYALDAANNRTSRAEGTRTRRYGYADDSNRLTTVGNNALTYDARGNMVVDRSGQRSFVYDATNRMVEFHKDGDLRATYNYDAHGRRIRKVLVRTDGDGTKSVRFVYDTDGRLLSETSRRTDRSAVRARDLVWLGGLPLAQVERRLAADGTTQQANVLSLHTDHLNVPHEARSETGQTVWRWTRDAFGAGPGGTRQAGVERDPDGDGTNTEVSIRFPGQYHDRESGLFYNHHRDYDPVLGRYVQSDPIGLAGGINRYAYVGGDPVNWIDPAGLNYTSHRIADMDCFLMEVSDQIVRVCVDTGGGSGDGTSRGRNGILGFCPLLGSCMSFGSTGGSGTSSPPAISIPDILGLNPGSPGGNPVIGDPGQGGAVSYAQIQIGDTLLDFECFNNAGKSFCERKKRYLYDWVLNPALCAVTGFANVAYVAVDMLDSPASITRYSAQSIQILEQISATLEVENGLVFQELIAGRAVPGITDFPGGIDQGMVRFEQGFVQQHLDALTPSARQTLINESNGVLNGLLAQYGHLLLWNNVYLNNVRDQLGRDIDFGNQSDRIAIGDEMVRSASSRTCRVLL